MAHTPKTIKLEIEIAGLAEVTDELLRLRQQLSELEARLDRIDPEGVGV